MSHTLLQPHITKLFGIDELSLDEQAIFLSEVGDSIVETSLVRFMSTASPEVQAEVETYLAVAPEPDVLIDYLLTTYEDFAPIVASVAAEVKTEAEKALLKKDSEITIIDA
jgi:hypothetical protein